MLEVDPGSSTRENTINNWTILKYSLLYPYHIQRVQALVRADFPPRITLCQLLLQTWLYTLRSWRISQEMQ